MVAEAEAMRAEMLSRTALGQQTSLLEIYANMIAKSQEGVEKVIYCDPTLQQAGTALTLPALANLNRDLHMLGGIAEGGNAAGSSFNAGGSSGYGGAVGGTGDSFTSTMKPNPNSTGLSTVANTPAR